MWLINLDIIFFSALSPVWHSIIREYLKVFFWALSVLQKNSLHCIFTCVHIALKSTEVLRARWIKEQESKKIEHFWSPRSPFFVSFYFGYISLSKLFRYQCRHFSSSLYQNVQEKITLLDCILPHGQIYQYTFCSMLNKKWIFNNIIWNNGLTLLLKYILDFC